VRQAPGHGVPRAAFAAATPAPARRIVLLDTAGKHRPVRLQFLPHDDETELVEAAERRHIRGREGSVKHVEVFLDGCVRTPILGRPRPLPRHRRADRPRACPAAGYTLNWEEPKYVTNTLYIALSWMPVLLAGAGVDLPFGAYALMAAGGLLYSAGFVVFVLERPNPVPGFFGFHEIWHVVVVAAAVLHYLLMYRYVLPA
jgi:hypothetical protein